MGASTRAKATGREACVAALRAAGQPLTAGEIADAVLEAGVVPTLKGKTPEATLAALVSSKAKRGETFKRTTRGGQRPARYALRADAADSDPELVRALRPSVRKLTRA